MRRLSPHPDSLLLCAIILLMLAPAALAHSGDLDAKGGHTNRKTGEYHFYRKATDAVIAAQTNF